MRIRCDDARDRYVAAQAAFSMARAVGLPRERCRAVELCAAELASNAARHAIDGVLIVRPLADRPGVEIVCEDRGPGVSEPELAIADGWSRGRALEPGDRRSEGLGTGLGTIRRLATSFSIEPREGGGMIATVRIEL